MRRKSNLEMPRSPSLKWSDNKRLLVNPRNVNINNNIDKRNEKITPSVPKYKTNERTSLTTPRSANLLPKSPQRVNKASPHSSNRLHTSNELIESSSPNSEITSKLTTNDKLRLCGIRPGTKPARLFLESQLAMQSRQSENDKEDKGDSDNSIYEPVESRQNMNRSNIKENIKEANVKKRKQSDNLNRDAAVNVDSNNKSDKTINITKEKEKDKQKVISANNNSLPPGEEEEEEQGIVEVQKASTQELSSAKAKLSLQDMVQSNPEQYSKWHNKNKFDLPCPRVVVLSLNSNAKNKSSKSEKPLEQMHQQRPYLDNENGFKYQKNQQHYSSHHYENNLPPLLDKVNFEKSPEQHWDESSN